VRVLLPVERSDVRDRTASLLLFPVLRGANADADVPPACTHIIDVIADDEYCCHTDVDVDYTRADPNAACRATNTIHAAEIFSCDWIENEHVSDDDSLGGTNTNANNTICGAGVEAA
jgi:hypothetical protein